MSEAVKEGDGEATVLYEKAGERVARVTLNRPDRANAQNYQMLYELNAAFDRAVADDEVRVIVLAANGKHFSLMVGMQARLCKALTLD